MLESEMPEHALQPPVGPDPQVPTGEESVT